MHCVTLPDSVLVLHLFGDNDKLGRDLVERSIRDHARDGRRIVTHFPPQAFKDWADVTAAQRG
jgi:hypothetical protein